MTVGERAVVGARENGAKKRGSFARLVLGPAIACYETFKCTSLYSARIAHDNSAGPRVERQFRSSPRFILAVCWRVRE